MEYSTTFYHSQMHIINPNEEILKCTSSQNDKCRKPKRLYKKKKKKTALKEHKGFTRLIPLLQKNNARVLVQDKKE